MATPLTRLGPPLATPSLCPSLPPVWDAAAPSCLRPQRKGPHPAQSSFFSRVLESQLCSEHPPHQPLGGCAGLETHPPSPCCPWPRGLPPPALLTSLTVPSLGDAAQHPAGATGRVFPAPVGRPGLWTQRGSCWEARLQLIISAPSLVLTSQAEGKKARASTRTEVAGPDRWGPLPLEERKPSAGGTRAP